MNSYSGPSDPPWANCILILTQQPRSCKIASKPSYMPVRVTDNDVRYQPGKLPDLVLGFFGQSNWRFLNDLHPGHPAWQKVKGFLKGLKLDQEGVTKIRAVENIIPRAGSYKFELRDGQEITIQV